MLKSETGWRVADAHYRITPVDGGRVMPTGWLITNYEVANPSTFRKRSLDDDSDLRFSRDDHDVLLVLRNVRPTEAKLSLLGERALESLRTQAREIETRSTTHYDAKRTVLSVSFEVEELAAKTFDVPGGEGYEVIADRFVTARGSRRKDTASHFFAGRARRTFYDCLSAADRRGSRQDWTM